MKPNKNCKNKGCLYYQVCRQYEAKWCVWIMDSIKDEDLFDIEEVAKYNRIKVWKLEETK